MMTHGTKLRLAAAGMVAVAGPFVLGLMAAGTSRPAFEVVSVKPNHGDGSRVMVRMAPGGRFVAQNVTVKFLLEEAYGVKDSQLSGTPGWLDSEHYDIEAKAEDAAVERERTLAPEQRHEQVMLMLQSMLADRFKLALHHETKALPVYALVVAKSGAKLHETPAAPADSAPPEPLGKPGSGPAPRGSIMMKGRGNLEVNGIALSLFADALSRQLGLLVVDQTGLKGEYDFTLKWTPDDGQGQMFRGAGDPGTGQPAASAPTSDSSGPSIFTALQEQLGLKLESQKAPVDTLVIDHVERPSEN